MHLNKTHYALSAVILISACASAPRETVPIRTLPQPDGSERAFDSVRPESGPVQAANVDRLYPNDQLFVCRGMRVQNKPRVDSENRVLGYSKLVVVDGPYGEVPVVLAPANNACVSSGFGMRTLNDRTRPHNGIDITSRPASYIFAGAAGTVLESGPNSGYGQAVLIDHGNGVYTRYGHMEYIRPEITEGARVVYGQGLGRMGKTGYSTGIHLHYEILTGDYVPNIRGRGLTPRDPFSFRPWVDNRLS